MSSSTWKREAELIGNEVPAYPEPFAPSEDFSTFLENEEARDLTGHVCCWA